MNPIPILAIAEKARVPFSETLPHLAGLLMVVLTLATLWGVCAVTARLVRIIQPQEIPTAPAPAPPSEPASTGITPEILAVIAAATAATIGKSHRIVSIKPTSTSWERAGRQSVLTSHHIR